MLKNISNRLEKGKNKHYRPLVLQGGNKNVQFWEINIK